MKRGEITVIVFQLIILFQQQPSGYVSSLCPKNNVRGMSMRYNQEKMNNCVSFVSEVISHNLMNKYISAKTLVLKKYFFRNFPSERDLIPTLFLSLEQL